MKEAALTLMLAALAGCQSVTVVTPDGTRIKSVNTGDLGNVALTDSTGSAGGLTSLIAGNVSTSRTSAMGETAPGYLRTTTANGTIVEIGGVVNNSTSYARHWDGATSMLRNWVARLVAGDLFDAVDTKTNQAEQTSRLKSTNEAKVKVNASNNTLKARQSDNLLRALQSE